MGHLNSKAQSRKIIIILLAVICFFTIGGTFYYYHKYQQVKKDPSIANKQENDSLKEAVGKLMALPKDEEPTVATVTDKGKLKDQDFFKDSQNGDKLLAYVKAKQAILYRPSTNKIVKVAPLYINDDQTSSNDNASNSKITLYNGTKNPDAINSAESKIKEQVDDVSFGTTTNANRTNYTKTTVVDISGGQDEVAKKIASALGGAVGSLPKGETAPSDGSTILVIVGKS